MDTTHRLKDRNKNGRQTVLKYGEFCNPLPLPHQIGIGGVNNFFAVLSIWFYTKELDINLDKVVTRVGPDIRQCRIIRPDFSFSGYLACRIIRPAVAGYPAFSLKNIRHPAK